MQSRADDGRELRHVGDCEVYREGIAHRGEDLAYRVQLCEISRQHNIVDPAAACREDREHSDRFGYHIDDAEGYVVLVGKVGKIPEVRRGEVGLYIGINLRI